MSQFLIELGSVQLDAAPARFSPAHLRSLSMSDLADSFLEINSLRNQLSEAMMQWRFAMPTRQGGGDSRIDMGDESWEDANELAEAWARIRGTSLGDADVELDHLAEAYDEIFQLSDGFAGIQEVLNARLASGYSTDDEFLGACDLAEAMMEWRFGLPGSPGGGDRRIEIGKKKKSFFSKIGKAAKSAVKGVGKLVKKVAPMVLAIGGAALTGGATAGAIGPALSSMFGGKKGEENQAVAADLVAGSSMLEKVGIQLPPSIKETAAGAAQALMNTSGGEEKVAQAQSVLRQGAAVRGQKGVFDQANAFGEPGDVLKSQAGGFDFEEIKPYLMYGGIGIGGLMVLSMLMKMMGGGRD